MDDPNYQRACVEGTPNPFPNEDQIIEAIEYRMQRHFDNTFDDFASWIYDSELGQHLKEEYDEQESDFELPSGRKFDVVVQLVEVK